MKSTILPTTPGAIIGYKKDGRPIHLIGGGSVDDLPGDGQDGGQSGDQNSGGDGGQAGSGQDTGNAGTGQQTGQSGGQNSGAGADKQDVKSLPDWAQKLITDARADAGKARTTAKQQAADDARNQLAQEIGKALGFVKDDKETTDPAKLAEQVGSLTGDLRSARIELAVFKAASKHGADPQALTDSRTFLEKAAKLDPTASDFLVKLGDAIKKAVEENPKLKAQPAGPARNGADLPGGPGGGNARPTSLREAYARGNRG